MPVIQSLAKSSSHFIPEIFFEICASWCADLLSVLILNNLKPVVDLFLGQNRFTLQFQIFEKFPNDHLLMLDLVWRHLKEKHPKS